MSSAFNRYLQSSKEHLRSDFLASIVVFLVALPLCIGISVAVGVNPALGLITGIIGGLVVGLVAGSPLQVSGPAASLFVIVADIVATRREEFTASPEAEGLLPEALQRAADTHALSALGVSVCIAGVIQFVAGRYRLGRWFRAVSPAVIKGMLSGIGALILISQFHVMLDHKAMWGEKAARGGLQYLATIPTAVMKCFDFNNGSTHFLAALIGVVTIASIVVWSKYAPKKVSFIPGALVGILAATVFSSLMGFNVIQLDVPQNMFGETTLPSAAWGPFFLDRSTWLSAFVIALSLIHI